MFKIEGIDCHRTGDHTITLNPDKYSRQVTLTCPTCASTEFEFDPGIDESIAVYKCISCEREFTKNELIQENAENIDEHLSEIKKEAMKDVSKEVKNTLKEAFRGSKYIKIK